MKHILLTTVLLVVFFSQAQEVKMTPTEISHFKSRVEKTTKALTSIQTDFKQEKHLSFLSNTLVSSGKMYLTSDGKLKWAYLSPNKYSIIFACSSIYINDNGHKTTVDGNQKMFQKLSHLIAGSLSGELFNDNGFTASYFKENNMDVLKLVPNDPLVKKYIKTVKLYFPKNDGTVVKVKLVEPSGDYTIIHFINKKTNVAIPSSVFAH